MEQPDFWSHMLFQNLAACMERSVDSLPSGLPDSFPCGNVAEVTACNCHSEVTKGCRSHGAIGMCGPQLPRMRKPRPQEGT